jgi:hypothetical protein
MIFIKYREVELKCEFKMDSYEEATMYQPDEGGEVYDLKVYIQDVDVTEIFEHSQLEEIIDLILEQL